MIYTTKYVSPLGNILIAADEEGLIGLWFEGQKYYADTIENENTRNMENEMLRQTKQWLDLYFSGKEPDFTPSIHMKTTEFRKRVWEILLSIPYGRTMTYGQIAKQLAKELGIASMSAQAVGGAVGHNAVSIIIPCHRVIGTDGSLTGYAGGLDKKTALLRLEKGGTIA